ncbi:MAG: hypothetical protein QNK11_09060 [Legionella sp.]|nr:hypothetical protein [Legionella sp.]
MQKRPFVVHCAHLEYNNFFLRNSPMPPVTFIQLLKNILNFMRDALNTFFSPALVETPLLGVIEITALEITALEIPALEAPVYRHFFPNTHVPVVIEPVGADSQFNALSAQQLFDIFTSSGQHYVPLGRYKPNVIIPPWGRQGDEPHEIYIYRDNGQLETKGMVFHFSNITKNIKAVEIKFDLKAHRSIEDLVKILSAIPSHVQSIKLKGNQLFFNDDDLKRLGPVELRSKLILDESELHRFVRSFPSRLRTSPQEALEDKAFIHRLTSDLVKHCSFFLREGSEINERERANNAIVAHFS